MNMEQDNTLLNLQTTDSEDNSSKQQKEELPNPFQILKNWQAARKQDKKVGLWDLIKLLFEKYRHFVIYCLIGFINTGVDLGVYWLLCFFGMHHLIANIFSYHCGIVCSFLLNGNYNFKVKDKWLQRFLSFYIICLLGFGLSELCIYLCVDICGLHQLLGKLISIIVVTLFQFLLAKRFTFKQ